MMVLMSSSSLSSPFSLFQLSPKTTLPISFNKGISSNGNTPRPTTTTTTTIATTTRTTTTTGRRRRRRKTPSISASFSDPFVLQIAETLEDSLSSSSSSNQYSNPTLEKLHENSSLSLLSKPFPTLKDEPFRFTDLSLLKNSPITPINPSQNPPHHHFSSSSDSSSHHHHHGLTVVDGLITSLLTAPIAPTDAFFVGPLSAAPEVITRKVLDVIGNYADGDLFWDLNGVGVPDVSVVYVPPGCRVLDSPLHLGFVSSQTDGQRLMLSSPRTVVIVDQGGEIGIVEEYWEDGGGNMPYWTNSIVEVFVGRGATVRHSYIQRQSVNAAHTKWTFVQQEASSTYELVETSTGGKLSRHNLHIQQVGPDTVTKLSTFHLSRSKQTQDLHSRLVLNHPRGFSRQLHKCIVAHSSGHAVFDGNVKVNRYAQQTDAGQLTRSLLLVPRATVNVKPNLQIIANDVKCSHGAAISDLEDDQLFYFRTRGVDLQTARNALIFSFGADVTGRLPYKHIRKRVESHIKGLLTADEAFQ